MLKNITGLLAQRPFVREKRTRLIYIRKNAQLVLNMIELANLNSVVDRLVHVCWNRLFMA